MLSAENITYRVGSKTLLSDVTVRFNPGKLNLIVGPNGAGKSTLIKAISNQVQPQSGTISYGEKNIRTFSVSEIARLRAVLTQNIDFAFPLTVLEVVMMGRYPHFAGKPGEKDERACEETMRFFDVWEMADRNILTLSGGEKQRVHFARVLSQIWYPLKNSSRYLILDEPLTFLDVYYQFQFMRKIRELLKQEDIIIAGVVHDLNLAAKFADHIVLLNKGKVICAGTSEEVFTKENIKEAYQLEPVIRHEENILQLFFL
jgi:iron complex transport system ATP-binding protein